MNSTQFLQLSCILAVYPGQLELSSWWFDNYLEIFLVFLNKMDGEYLELFPVFLPSEGQLREDALWRIYTDNEEKLSSYGQFCSMAASTGPILTKSIPDRTFLPLLPILQST